MIPFLLVHWYGWLIPIAVIGGIAILTDGMTSSWRRWVVGGLFMFCVGILAAILAGD